ncbi:putative sporulation protein YtxC [Bacillus marasmi]|uniref:putative sporulation protein YtxC n=1 Tax=Bacillus marasmi TaxID=1926279 RepID=UPI0011CA67C2|nr:putative sporulation protein YtxC [Bacillus marasmi]
MIEIHFQRREDAMPFYQLVKKNLLTSQPDNHILLEEEQCIVTILTEALTEKAFYGIKKLFYEFILYTKCDDWFRSILTERFLYSDEEEIQQILDIIHSILEGERSELAEFVKDYEEKNLLKKAIHQVMKRNISFSFDSFVKFRLREFCARLERYVELSIDEYKMEQEYQMFIQTLREFISTRSSLLACLHILIDEDIMFFDAQFSELKKMQLTKMIDRKLLFNHPVYVDSTTIAPLLSIAPENIYLYCKEPDQPLIRTIRNIFEERVLINSISAFHERRYDRSEIDKRIP